VHHLACGKCLLQYPERANYHDSLGVPAQVHLKAFALSIVAPAVGLQGPRVKANKAKPREVSGFCCICSDLQFLIFGEPVYFPFFIRFTTPASECSFMAATASARTFFIQALTDLSSMLNQSPAVASKTSPSPICFAGSFNFAPP
jgi:hypothetical protein